MKKFLIGILSVILFLPIIVLADITSYEQLDIRVNIEYGTQVRNIGFKIYANTNEDEVLRNRTEEFTASLSIFKVKEDNSKEILPDDYILKGEENYGFYLSNIKANNNATLNINELSKVLINTEQKDNDELKISVSENVLNIEYTLPKVKVIDEDKFEAVKEEPVVEEKNSCLLGLSICCKEFKGISYCMLGVYALIGLVVIIILINFIVDKHDDKKYKDF